MRMRVPFGPFARTDTNPARFWPKSTVNTPGAVSSIFTGGLGSDILTGGIPVNTVRGPSGKTVAGSHPSLLPCGADHSGSSSAAS